MKIYTRTGDQGSTGLWGTAGEKRIAKNAPRVEAYGTVDEANAALGVAAACLAGSAWPAMIHGLQHRLFALGADLSTLNPARRHHLADEDVQELERLIDALDQTLPPLTAFILPGGTAGAAALHQARTIVRRAERRVVDLYQAEPGPAVHVAWLNRLSDVLFVMARAVNQEAGVDEVQAQFRAMSE